MHDKLKFRSNGLFLIIWMPDVNNKDRRGNLKFYSRAYDKSEALYCINLPFYF